MYNNQRTNDYQSDFLITVKPLISWKVHVLVITLLVLLYNCLLQASVLLVQGYRKCSVTASLVTVNPASLMESSGEAFLIHISEATRNMLHQLGL